MITPLESALRLLAVSLGVLVILGLTVRLVQGEIGPSFEPLSLDPVVHRLSHTIQPDN